MGATSKRMAKTSYGSLRKYTTCVTQTDAHRNSFIPLEIEPEWANRNRRHSYGLALGYGWVDEGESRG